MVQALKILGVGGALGIVPVLFVLGIVLILTKISISLGYLAVIASVFIGIVYAVLGVFGILKRL